MGSSHDCTGAELQVSEVSQNIRDSEVLFEFISLSCAPAGFEPALTAPERVAVHASDQGKRVPAHPVRGRIGGSPVRSPEDGCVGVQKGALGQAAWSRMAGPEREVGLAVIACWPVLADVPRPVRR